MKRILYILFGSIILGLITYIGIGVFGHWFENKVAQNENDLSIAYMWLLAIQTLSFIVGGILGNWIYNRKKAD
ncbi:MAG: hypothetical protein NTU44_06085 [Bacteroidetes bacterium]|nr:hypothetical protein [Bacteroidota bacterium]